MLSHLAFTGRFDKIEKNKQIKERTYEEKMDDLAGIMLMYGIAGRLRQGVTVGKKGNGKQNKAERRRNHRRSNGRSHRGRNRSKAYNLPDSRTGY